MGKILVIGSLNMDFVISVNNMPKVGETIFGSSLELIPGGKGANQAFAAGKLGSEVCMIGAVGGDNNGQILIENLKSAGVDTSGICCVKNQSTGAAFITVDQKGQNSIVVIPGANMNVSAELIDRNINLLDECDIVLMQLEIPIETVVYAAKIAKKKGKTVIIDPAPAPRFLPDELLQNVDIIKPNESELETLTQTSLDDMYSMKDIVNASKTIIDRGAKVVIATLGKRGAVLVSKDISLHSPTIESVKVVDTTAAGDCFTAAFASCFIKSNSYEQAIKYANAASSVAVTRKGAQSSMPTAEEVSDMISRLE